MLHDHQRPGMFQPSVRVVAALVLMMFAGLIMMVSVGIAVYDYCCTDRGCATGTACEE